MLGGNQYSIAMLCVWASLLIGCGSPDSGTRNTSKVLNLFIWSDFLAPDTIASFEKLTGVKVNISYFDTNETLESRMLTGRSGFDVVAPVAPYFQREIRSGAYLTLDKKQLPNLANLDPALMSRVALNDPGNAHGIVYTWGTFGIGYNEKKMAALLPNAPLDSWRLIFDPAFAAKLAACGINILDTGRSTWWRRGRDRGCHPQVKARLLSGNRCSRRRGQFGPVLPRQGWLGRPRLAHRRRNGRFGSQSLAIALRAQ